MDRPGEEPARCALDNCPEPLQLQLQLRADKPVAGLPDRHGLAEKSPHQSAQLFFYDGCTTGWYGTCAWTNSTAASIASTYYQDVLHGMRTTGWPVLNSEGGASYFSEAACTSPSCTPPDTRLVGDAGYAGASFYFINALTSDYDASGHGIGWAWWPTGDWTNSPCPTTSSGGGCLYGALSANMGSAGSVPGWGILLRLPVSLSLTSDFSANSSASNSPEHATTDGFPSRGQ